MEPECACGHMLDEHDEAGECTVVDETESTPCACPCFAFEEAGD